MEKTHYKLKYVLILLHKLTKRTETSQ